MNHPPQFSLCHRLLILTQLVAWLAPLFVGSIASAAIGHSLQSFSETNYSGFLIKSDVTNVDPLYDRDAIETKLTMQYSRTGVSDNHYEYRYNYQLLNEAGTAQVLALGGGATGTTLTVWEDVDMTGGLAVISRNTTTRITPNSRLDQQENYRVRITIARRVPPAGVIVNTLLTSDTPPQTYKHFNQLPSGDVALNVLSTVSSVSWNRESRIQTDVTRDSFRVQAVISLSRYDDFAAPSATSAAVGTRLSVVMRDDLNNVVPLEQSVFEFDQNIATFVEGNVFVPRNPASNSAARILDLRPVNQLPSRSRTYTLRVTVGHYETPGDGLPFAGGNLTSVATTLLDFNGTLAFAGTTGSFTSIASPAPVVGSLAADHIVTSLRINNQSGSFQGLAFGSGAELPVKLFDTGVAHLSGGSFTLSGIGMPLNPGDIDYTLESVVVTPTAITGTVRLKLPSGLGVAADAQTRIHEANVTFSNTPLTPQLKPVAATLSSAAVRWAAEESKPFVFESSALNWDVAAERIRFTATGNAQFVRSQAYSDLLSDPLVGPDQKVKLSNDGYYGNLTTVTSPEVVITIDGANHSALMTCDIAMGGSLYVAHFPHNSLISASSGAQRIVNDKVDPSFGGLSGVENVRVGYRRDCPDGACGSPAGAENLFFTPAGDHLSFTRDGGVAGSGTLSAPKALNWGWIATANKFAHTAETFTAAGFHASGLFLAASELGAAALEPEIQPARLLYTGISPSAANTVERPGTNAYKAGLGDYAGLNFRVIDWGDQDGELVLAGASSPPFPLTNRAKYLVRQAGISGIHEAINGQFAPTAVIYGMDFEFTSLGWAFLDGEAITSRTDGNLTVPFPSDFNLEFEKIQISCNGALLGAEIAATDAASLKKLAYWNADFRPLTLAFEGKDANACDPSQRRLVLGVEGYAGGIPQPLSGTIGFQENGNLITLESKDLDPPFDSRFRLPNNFTIAGPAGQNYRATPVGEAYLNDYAVLPDGTGWMNLAAYFDVPFFSDMEVHLHTTAVKDDPEALYQVMGGYPDDGFATGGKHFFNEAIFDVSNRGFPKGTTLEDYRSSPTVTYHPIAHKKWLNVINLKYPLQWRAASRSFVSFADVTNDFLVLSASHRIDYLSADFVEVTFGGSISTLPKLSIANFVADKATDVTAILQQKLQTNVVDAGIQGLNDILDVKQREFFEKALVPAVDGAVDAVMGPITANWNPGPKTWQNQNLSTVIDQGLLDPNDGVVAQIRTMLAAARNVAGVLQEIDVRLVQAENALTHIEGFIEEKNGQPLGDLQTTVLSLASLVSEALEKPEFAEKIAALMERAEPRIIEIRAVISEVRNFITEVRSALDEGGQFADQVIDLVDDNLTTMESAAILVRNDIEKILKQVKPGVDSLPQLDAVIREKIKQRIHDYMLGLPVIAQFNRLIKQRLYDVSSLMTEAIDEVFDQINLTLRDIIREVVGGLDEKFEEMLGDAGASMATANIDGYAKVRNDSLTELRLDLKVSMSVPDEMKAHVFLVIRELSSENSPTECLPKTGKATEVTMGAKDISVEWLFPGTTVSIQSKFLINGDAEGFPLLGMGGGFDLTGEITFGEQIKIKQLGASVMFSIFEAYISAAAKIEVQGFSGGGGIFLGKACSADPFFWDPLVASVIGEPPFTGMYGYGEFWIPIPTLIGIPSTCLFNLSAGVGAGAGFFVEGPTVFGKMFLGVSGDVLCIVSITGEISLVGLARPSGLALAGEGRFSAEIGWCPICLKFDKMIRMARENGKWSRGVK